MGPIRTRASTRRAWLVLLGLGGVACILVGVAGGVLTPPVEQLVSGRGLHEVRALGISVGVITVLLIILVSFKIQVRQLVDIQLTSVHMRESRLIELTTAISEELQLQKMAVKVMTSVTEILDAERSTLFLLDPERNELCSNIAEGLEDRAIRIPVGSGIAGSVFQTGEVVNIRDAYEDDRFNRAVDQRTGYRTRSILAMQIQNKTGTALGVIQVLNRRGGPFTDRDEQRLRLFAAQMAIAIENAQLFEQVRTTNLELEVKNRQIQRANAELADKNRQLEDTHQATRRFVPLEFLELLHRETIRDIERGDHVELDVGVMFADLRSFTSILERLLPEQAFAFINEYLSFMEPEIHREGGFINQYLGDGIMAIFPDGADGAVRAAGGMMRALDRFNAQQELPVKIGIGINHGTLMMGTIGGGDRLDNGVIGDVVNLAARVESLTKHYRTPVLLTEHTRARLSNPDAFRLRELDRVVTKGKTRAVVIYELLDALPEGLQDGRQTPGFTEALARYQAGDFERALEAFQTHLEHSPHDGPAEIYIERCLEHLVRGDTTWKGATWMGVK